MRNHYTHSLGWGDVLVVLCLALIVAGIANLLGAP